MAKNVYPQIQFILRLDFIVGEESNVKQNGAALAMTNGANGDLSEGEEEPKQTFVDNAMQQIKPKIGSPNKESGNTGPVPSANIMY